MNSWRLGFADAWPTWNKMLCMICYMLHCKHLHDRYDKSGFFFFSDFIFHYWAAFMVYQQNRVNNTTSSSLKNIFVLTIFKMGLFGLLTDQGAKMPTSIKSVTHILKWWNVARLYLTWRRFKTYINTALMMSSKLVTLKRS